jgi:hypothetical protein
MHAMAQAQQQRGGHDAPLWVSNTLLAEGTHWRFLNELKRELKA